jgi:uncharacterized delta-60 repeat protein
LTHATGQCNSGDTLNSVYPDFYGPGPRCGDSTTAFMARLTDKGKPDPGFHQRGVAAIQWQGVPAPPIVGPKDMVIYGGHAFRNPTPVAGCEQGEASDAFLESLSAHGAPAASWPGGWTTLHPTSTSPVFTWYVDQIALDRFGRLFVLETVEDAGLEGRFLNNSLEARHVRNGASDTGFGGRGAVSGLDDYNHVYNAIATDSKGRVLLAGVRWAGPIPRTSSFQLLRLRRDGRTDTSFGKNGDVTTSFGQGDSYGQQVFVDGHGRILVAGVLFKSSDTYGFAIARYLP